MRYCLIILATFFAFTAFGQETEEETPAAELIKQATNRKKDRFVIDIGFDNWFHQEENGFQTKWYSKGFGFAFMYDYQIGNSFLSVAPGFGFRTSHIHHNSTILKLDTAVAFVPIPEDSFTRNKFVIHSLEIPLELRFRTKPNEKGQSFKVGLGAKFGIKAGAFYKNKSSNDFGERQTTKVKRFDDVNPVQFGPTVRIGYGAFNLFMYYNALNVFKEGAGPDANQFSIGISINGL